MALNWPSWWSWNKKEDSNLASRNGGLIRGDREGKLQGGLNNFTGENRGEHEWKKKKN